MKQIVFDFLKDLKTNNNREWFQANKKRYDEARHEFESLVENLIPQIRAIDPMIDMITARDCMFRIYRDVRFSPDKSPYKTNMGAYIARGGKSSTLAGYYVHIEPEGSFLAGGIYMPPSEVLKKIREDIYFRPETIKSIINHPEFVKCFGAIEDHDRMKNPPKGYPKDFPDIELLKYRNYTVMHHVKDELAASGSFPEHSIGVFRILQPFNTYFNQILA